MSAPSDTPQQADDLGFELPRPARVSKVTVAIGSIVVLGALFAVAYLPRRSASAKLDASSSSNSAALPRVEVIAATEVKTDHALALPATVSALEQTTIFPRVSGYVREWKVDLGDHVTAGQSLATIDTPETDANLAQARANVAQANAALAQAKAHADFSKGNAARYQALGDQKLVATQTVEENQTQAGTDQANVEAAQAAIVAAQANVRQLVDQKAFANVTAPFAGVITSRTIDRGALVSAGNTTPLFTVASIDPVRVFVQVPQSVAPSVKADVAVDITAREYPSRKFTGKVTRTAGALDPTARTMTTEVRVPNPDGALLPGMYETASLSLPQPQRTLEIPSTALYSDAEGVRVAVVAEGKIHFAPVAIERDTGATIQISTGLRGDEKIVKVAVPSLTEGEAVEVAPAAAPAAAGH